jgi:lysozyme family protein
MANFNPAFQITMGNEGGYADNPADPGGETWKGIARHYWPAWSGWAIVDKIKATNPPNINTALNAEAELQQLVLAFYKQHFWDTEMLDEINDQQTANQLFDSAVNMGTGVASRFLQQGIDTLKPGVVTVDGVVGPATIAAANALPAKELYNAICNLRRQRYMQIIAQNPREVMFEHSWMSRITPYTA